MGTNIEYIKETINREKIRGYFCDNCKKESKDKYSFIEYTFQHFEWDNDSIDSIENGHICSIKCFKELIEKEEFIGDKYLSSRYELTFGNKMLKGL